MTIEKKAKAYDKVLERATQKWESGLMTREELEDLFPELAESEDEKIRKALIEMVHDTTCDELWVDYNVHKEEALAWLEKQGSQKLANSAKTCKNEQKTTDKCEGCNNVKGCVACVDGSEWAHIDEQKPAWSEEDDKVVANLVDYFKVDDALQYTEKQVVEWLKALKNRIRSHKQWRPSDEQMEALEEITEIVGSHYKPYMNSLYQELKKLREE